MNFLLDVNFNQSIYESANAGEALIFGLQVVLIGMLAIFAVLALIWGCLAIFKLVLHDLPAKRGSEAPVKEVAAIEEKVQEVVHAADDEIVAVIAAAIAAAESEASGLKYRVVSFRRK